MKIDLVALPPRKNLSINIYERIESAIVSGRLAPGTKLADDQIAETFRVSRSPVREAIAELSKVGFAERASTRDRRVTVPTESFATDCFDVWVLLESERLYEASRNCDAEGHRRIDTLLQQLEDADQRPGRPDAGVIAEFHVALSADCRNQQLQRISRDWHKYIQWLRNLFLDESSMEQGEALEEHRQLVRLFKERDRDGLVQVMRLHMHWQRDRIVQEMGRQRRHLGATAPPDAASSLDMKHLLATPAGELALK